MADLMEGNKVFANNKVLAGKQNANETSSEVEAKHARAIALIVDRLDTAVSGGVVKLEGAPYSNYPNTWLELASITVGAGKGLQSININENDDNMPCPIVRARITTKVGNGTIDAYIVTQG